MKAFLHHCWVTLKLNFRNPQAVVFGYVVPLFFLVAFTALKTAPMHRLLGQLLTITALGGACFGMPIGFVSERERGVWRRYRLTPVPTSVFVLSVLVARYVIVLSGAVLQVGLALWVYKMPVPRDPLGLFLAFTVVCFALLAIGLVISMVANSTHAVQAIGQSLFLPMILIGGVGVPLDWLPDWAKHVAAFLPGRYAVQAIDATVLSFDNSPLGPQLYTSYNLVALGVIGLAAALASVKIFRWENSQKLPARGLLWVALSIAAWGGVGLIAEANHYVIPEKRKPAATAEAKPLVPPKATTKPTAPASAPAAVPG